MIILKACKYTKKSNWMHAVHAMDELLNDIQKDVVLLNDIQKGLFYFCPFFRPCYNLQPPSGYKLLFQASMLQLISKQKSELEAWKCVDISMTEKKMEIISWIMLLVNMVISLKQWLYGRSECEMFENLAIKQGKGHTSPFSSAYEKLRLQTVCTCRVLCWCTGGHLTGAQRLWQCNSASALLQGQLMLTNCSQNSVAL